MKPSRVKNTPLVVVNVDSVISIHEYPFYLEEVSSMTLITLKYLVMWWIEGYVTPNLFSFFSLTHYSSLFTHSIGSKYFYEESSQLVFTKWLAIQLFFACSFSYFSYIDTIVSASYANLVKSAVEKRINHWITILWIKSVFKC